MCLTCDFHLYMHLTQTLHPCANEEEPESKDNRRHRIDEEEEAVKESKNSCIPHFLTFLINIRK